MSGFTEAKFNAGEVLFKAGDPAKELFILQKGEIELLDRSSGKAFAKLKAGESFGEQAVLAGGVRSATAVAKEDCVCLKLTADGLTAILSKESTMSNLLFRALHLQLFMQNALSQVR
jgi:CRP/FNR family cyclic AMP-dependent transcriptional regulator